MSSAIVHARGRLLKPASSISYCQFHPLLTTVTDRQGSI